MNIYRGSARNAINHNYLTVRHFSANGMEFPLGEEEMKIFKRSALRGFAAHSRIVLSRLASLAIHEELASRLDRTPISLPTIKRPTLQ